jgi:hypothetical protein
MSLFYVSVLVFFVGNSVCAQSPVTVPVPPLQVSAENQSIKQPINANYYNHITLIYIQWIRLNPTGNNSPPALAYAAAGFDTANKQLVLFGGETSGGLLNSNTYLLDMSTMAWTTPSPSTNTNVKPPARSRALYGHDMIAS